MTTFSQHFSPPTASSIRRKLPHFRCNFRKLQELHPTDPRPFKIPLRHHHTERRRLGQRNPSESISIRSSPEVTNQIRKCIVKLSSKLSWNKHFRPGRKNFLFLYPEDTHTFQSLHYPLTFYANMSIINLLRPKWKLSLKDSEILSDDKVLFCWSKGCFTNETENYLMAPESA